MAVEEYDGRMEVRTANPGERARATSSGLRRRRRWLGTHESLSEPKRCGAAAAAQVEAFDGTGAWNSNSQSASTIYCDGRGCASDSLPRSAVGKRRRLPGAQMFSTHSGPSSVCFQSRFSGTMLSRAMSMSAEVADEHRRMFQQPSGASALPSDGSARLSHLSGRLRFTTSLSVPHVRHQSVGPPTERRPYLYRSSR